LEGACDFKFTVKTGGQCEDTVGHESILHQYLGNTAGLTEINHSLWYMATAVMALSVYLIASVFWNVT